MFTGRSDRDTLVTLRRILVAALLVGMFGTAGELLLIGHFESVWQIVPLALVGAGVVAVLWQLRTSGGLAVRFVQLVMVLFVGAGALGVGLHYDGNAEFELEMYPTLRGLALIGGTLTGATPVLAPGSMALLGLVGLAYTYRHPNLRSTQEPDPVQEDLP